MLDNWTVIKLFALSECLTSPNLLKLGKIRSVDVSHLLRNVRLYPVSTYTRRCICFAYDRKIEHPIALRGGLTTIDFLGFQKPEIG